ncbi:hypothetical protein [Atopomonas sediminilitoris]|uniref:hypothetical protein n=1 Tax=Atopomonas sediminilitoris TaxID=2919919 RepID=UPI001F4E748D|nr:hypothetical protein [Atopomonas sediminilitoris]MCJ8169592.1 hypothetical protein [Atopomonas sediminilitoris]
MLTRHALLALLMLTSSLSAQAIEEIPADRAEPIYLIGQLKLDGSSMSYSIFLHEPQVPSLDACNEAWRSGQQGDWPHYFHVFRRDLIKGFSAHIQYRCATSQQLLAPWEDRRDYNSNYLVHVEGQRFSLTPFNSFAACSQNLGQFSAVQQANRFCTKSNQVLR